MKNTEDPGRILRIHNAFKAGDLQTLLAAVDHPGVVPNGHMPPAIGPCLVYAVYHSPLAFIRTLLEMGADPNADADNDGFPPLIAAVGTAQEGRGLKPRGDAVDITKLLLSFGADPNTRGINDYTALHMAVDVQSLALVETLLDAGADPRVRTRIDRLETPRELASSAGLTKFEELLRGWEDRY